MAWFHEWWQTIGLTGQIMTYAAVPMTVVLIMQLVLMIIGADISGDSDAGFDGDAPDFDASGDGADAGFDIDASDMDGTDFDGADFDGAEFDAGTHDGEYAGSNPNAVRIITIRGIVAFFAIGGWAGLAALTGGLAPLWSIMIALFSGAAAMLFASFVLHFALRMQSSGNISLKYAIGHTAEVYITIPPLRKNTGKITMVLQDRFVELDAATDNEAEIRSGAKVEVIGLADKECLLVRPISEIPGN